MAKTWAERCKAIRKRLGLSQTSAAAEIECHRNTWVYWETKGMVPNKFYKKILEKMEKTEK